MIVKLIFGVGIVYLAMKLAQRWFNKWGWVISVQAKPKKNDRGVTAQASLI